jgi:malate dehydrogenase (oxaloacetate-decarboxylating)(NADP+)
MAATRALAQLAKEDVPESVSALYGLSNVKFGPEYLIPFPFDPRVLLRVAPAVAWAAVASGVAKRVHRARRVPRRSSRRGLAAPAASCAASPRRAVARPQARRLPRGRGPQDACAPRRSSWTRASRTPSCSGEETIRATAEELGIFARGHHDRGARPQPRHRENYAQYLWQRRQRKGPLAHRGGRQRVTRATTFGSVMVALRRCRRPARRTREALPETIRPALEVDRRRPRHGLVSGLYMLVFEKHIVFFGDTTVNIDPTAEQLAQIGWSACRRGPHLWHRPARRDALVLQLRVGAHPEAEKVAEAVRYSCGSATPR